MPVANALSDIYAVIAIGADLAADVVLATDPTQREMQLACRLLSEIVHLRREQVASRQTQQRLSELAEVDSLTGLANRRAWDIELQRRMSHSDGSDGTLCLMLLDLDHFKAINTTHGYTVADEVLRHVGSALQTSIRANDFAARIGGDEFAVLLPKIAAEHAETVVERIRTAALDGVGKDGEFKVTATAGLALRHPTDDAESLFSRADAHLRHGKVTGRNRSVASVERTKF